MSNTQDGKVNESEKLLSTVGNDKQKNCCQRHKKCILILVISQLIIWPCVFLAIHFLGKSGDDDEPFTLSAACLNADNAEYSVETPQGTTTWVEDVASNEKYWFTVVGNRNNTKTLQVYSADQKKLVKEVLMATNTTYLTTKDSKLTVTDDFAVLDLHAFPYQLPKKSNVSYGLDISGDPDQWGTPTLEPGFNYVQSVARGGNLAYQLVRDADGKFVLQNDDFSTNKTVNQSLAVQDGTSTDDIAFTYLSGANRFVFAYPDWTNEDRYVIQSYDADFQEEAVGVSLNITKAWTLGGVFPLTDDYACVYLYNKTGDEHQFIRVPANDVTAYEVIEDGIDAKYNISLHISPIKYQGTDYFFLMPNGKTRNEDFTKYPITVTKDFTKTYQLDIGDTSTRFVKMAGDRLVVAQSDTIMHTKMWQLGSAYTAKVMKALDGVL